MPPTPAERPRQFAGTSRYSLPLPTSASSSATLPHARTPPVARATQLGLGLGGGAGAGAGARNTHGSKGLGLGKGLKRHKKIQRDSIAGITKGDIRRLARRGGIKRISASIYEDVRLVIKQRLHLILSNTVPLLELSNRKTVAVTDVVYTLNRLGNPIYGFQPTFDGRHRA